MEGGSAVKSSLVARGLKDGGFKKPCHPDKLDNNGYLDGDECNMMNSNLEFRFNDPWLCVVQGFGEGVLHKLSVEEWWSGTMTVRRRK